MDIDFVDVNNLGKTLTSQYFIPPDRFVKHGDCIIDVHCALHLSRFGNHDD